MLRVYFDSPPDSARAFEWALFDARGKIVREGKDTPARWPQTQQREAVLSVTLAPCLSLDLPPMNAARLESAARLALEDRLATPIQQMHLVLAAPQNGRVPVRVIEKSLLDALRAQQFTRVIAEADLALTTAKNWRCCISENNKGFVRRDDGSAFAIELALDTPPSELRLALQQATSAPSVLRLDVPSADILKQRWQSMLSPTLQPGKAWNWRHADQDSFRQAINLLPVVDVPRHAISPRWRFALRLAVAALVLHIAATGIAWGASLWQEWQVKRGWQALAHEAGLPENSASIQRGWARAYARLRHDAGLAAPDDALPLLARAAPALNALPPNTLRSATYADGAWTLEWQTPDPATQQQIENALQQAGLFTLSGSSPTGYRLRIQAQEIAAQ